jgi:2,3-dihydro-2,3-dihydroxybenzoate dehydrogenase
MEHRIAVVTGAAGGIGAAVVEALAERGATVAAVDANEPHLHESAVRWQAKGWAVHPIPVDVTDEPSVQRTVAEVENQLGPIEYLVNAAGVLHLGRVVELTGLDWAHTFAVNATGVFLMSRAVVDRMLGRRRGAIVTITSNAGSTPRASMAAYSASKAAAAMFTKCLGLEVARQGIRCNVVAPGSTDTPMLRSMWRDESGPRVTLEGRAEEFRVGIPLGRIGTPSDIADAVLFLLSDQARHITMHDLAVDGGAALGR